MLAHYPLPTVLPHWDTVSARGPRKVNADATAVHTDPTTGLTAYVVADGVGDDETAARTARLAAEVAAGVAAVEGPVAGILAAQQAVISAAPGRDGGDCVLVVAVPQVGAARTGCDVAWVGDCRAYHWNGRILEQITNDHTVAEYFRAHNQAPTPRMEHLVTTSVRTTKPERIGRTRTSIGHSRLLLCSDGVHKTVDIGRIRAMLDEQPSPAVAANTLVEYAQLIGGKDNATSMIIDPPPVHAVELAA